MDTMQFEQYPPYPGDIGTTVDMMKRSMDPITTSGPDAKRGRWSPTSGNASADAFANYGYGPNASHLQPNQSQAQGQVYATGTTGAPPALTINTNGAANNGAPPPSPGAAQWGYNLLNGMNGLQGMNGMMGMMGGMGFPYNGQMGAFAQAFGQQPSPGGNGRQLPALNLTIPQSPAAFSAMSPLTAGVAAQVQNRTVYIGNLPATASVDELLNLVHFGPLESIRVLPEKSCVFLSFLDGATAAAFHADATIKKLSLHGQELKIGWGKPSPVPAQVSLAITQSGASRNVYVGGLDEGMTEEQLRDELSRFGLIDQVKIVRDKNIGFVHFLSIAVATKVVNTLPTEPNWAGKRVNYGKDRCAYIPKSQQAAAQQAQAAAAQSLIAQASSPALASPLTQTAFSPWSAFPGSPLDGMGLAGGMLGGAGMNRTVYLGNIHPETTTEDLCNSIRGGVLQSIRYMPDKHIAFVTFVDPAAAFTFFHSCSYSGLTINNRRLKVGWGKNSGPLSPQLALAVHSGATRNVYIGNIEDFEVWSEERLRRDFSEYGDVELVNFLKEKNCAFVNFTNIANAIKAIEGVKVKADYANLRIAHGKDRCANAPRSGPQGASGNRGGRSPGGTGAESMVAVDSELSGGDMEGVEVNGIGEYAGVVDDEA